MRKNCSYLLAAFLGSAVYGPVCAQTTEQPDESSVPRQYTVELIVFEYTDGSLDSNEVFVADIVENPVEDEPADELVFSDIPPAARGAQDSSKLTIDEIPAIRRLDLKLLEPEQYTMRDIYSRLQRLDAYRPIMHAGWTQTTVERNLTAPVRLRMLGNVPLKLDGDLTLYLSRYLHLVVDLQLDAVSLQPVNSYAPANSSLFDKPEMRPAAVRYRILEDRIFKSGDLRYFDHPKFGVLVRINRYESSVIEPARSGAMPAAGGTG
jgi:hypothetical protein